MPLYEFRCCECSRKFSQLIGMTADSRAPACPACGSENVTKLVSRFIRARGEDETLDALEEAALTSDPDDPKSMRKWLREMGSAMDEEGGDELEEYLEEAEREVYEDEESGEA